MVRLMFSYLMVLFTIFMIFVAAIHENFTDLGMFWNMVIGVSMTIIIIYLIIGITIEHIRDIKDNRNDV